MRRLALLGLALLVAACGSHVESGSLTVDPLTALERDPQAALAAAKHPTYKATYAMSIGSVLTAASASPGAALTSTEIYVARPPDFRWEVAVSDGVQSRVVVAVRGQDTFICVDGDSAGCYPMPVTYTQQMLDSLKVSPLDSMMSATKDMDVTVLPRERIADRDGACFRWRPRPAAPGSPSSTDLNSLLGQLGDVKLEACFSADGVMLRTLTSAGALFSVEQRATSIAGTVTDADLALPYPITSAPFPIATSAPLTSQTPRPTPPASPTKH